MKRFLVLLVVVAAGLTAAALAVPNNAAKVDGASISQSSLNADVDAIASSAQYQCYLNAQQYLSSGGTSGVPPVTGPGTGQGGGAHPTATSSFVATYLDTAIGHQLILNAAASRGVVASASEVAQARTGLESQISTVMTDILQTPEAQNPSFTCGVTGQPLTGAEILSTMPSSFVDQQVHFYATAGALQDDLAPSGLNDAGLRSYFQRHTDAFDAACFTAAAYQTVDAANAARAEVAAGTPFSTVAAQATQGGPQGCPVLSALAGQLPSSARIEQLATGEVSQPIAVNGAYYLVQITSRTPTAFEQAKSYVSQAVQQAGAAVVQRAVQVAARRASINVDPQYGTWVPDSAAVFPPLAPRPSNVLNASANEPATSATSAASSGG